MGIKIQDYSNTMATFCVSAIITFTAFNTAHGLTFGSSQRQMLALSQREFRRQASNLYSEPVEDSEDKLITDNIEEKLSNLSSKYPTSAVDYLAAARKRAE